MKLEQTNRHHGVPRSFTGSSDPKCNIALVDEKRHNDFHKAAGHLPPDFLLRAIVLASTDWHNNSGKKLPPGFTEDVLHEFTLDDWREIYVPGATRSPNLKSDEETFFAKSSVHVHNYISAEQYMVADSISFLEGGNYLHPLTQSFRRRIQKFTKEQNPAIAIQKILEERHNGKLAWAKPMKDYFRSRALVVAQRARPEPLNDRNRSRLIDALNEHRNRLVHCLDTWEPLADSYLPIIKEQSSEQQLFRSFLDRKTA